MTKYRLFDLVIDNYTAGYYARFHPQNVLKAVERFTPAVLALARRWAALAILLLFTAQAQAQNTAHVGHEQITVQGDSAVVQITLTPKAATTLLANQIPSRKSSEIDAAGEVLLIEYDPENKTYTVEESVFTRVGDVRKYARMWLREVLSIR